MNRTIRGALLASASAVALVLAPFAAGDSGVPGFDDTAAYAKNNGNNGNKGGGSRGNSGNRSNNSSRPDNPGGGGNNNNNNSNNGHGNPHVTTISAPAPAEEGEGEPFVPPGQARERNIHALLGGLNSIGRHIDGLMNSADSRMEAIRQFVVDNAEYELALAALEAAVAAQTAAQDAYNGYVSGLISDAGFDPADYGDLSPEALQNALAALEAEILAADPTADPLADPDYMALQDLLTEVQSSEALADLQIANDVATNADAEATAAMEGTAEQDLIAALIAGANPNADWSDEDIARIVEWANEVLGVGDFDGSIDDLLAMWAEAGPDDGGIPDPAPAPEDFDPEGGEGEGGDGEGEIAA